MASNFSTQNQIQRNILIVGLGNHDMPKTRHSVGMQVLNKLARELDIQWIKDSKKYGGFVSVHEFKENIKCVLLKPKVAMNLNGKSVQKTASVFGVLPEDVYVVHDDLDKAVGKVGLKNGGSARGHNGVKSVHQCLRYEGMSRMLVGIDRPADKSRVAEYVLSTFNGNERPLIDTAIKECILLLSQEIYKKYGMKLLHQRDTG